ncbi:trypsin-like peptidase domain-containing protein [Geitlerinema splendidum]|nr:trypsin-like peptidase domain-containing protein [Geitlerinema splendidum]
MGIGADIIEFFYIGNAQSTNNQGKKIVIPKSIDDFLSTYPKHQKYHLKIAAMCHQLVGIGLLVKAGSSRKSYPPFNENYLAPKFIKKEADYGVYDFALSGFSEIHKYFINAVRPVLVKKANDGDDIGSGFMVKNHYFVTAKHCIEQMKEVKIRGWNPDKSPLKRIWIPSEKNLDLAVLEFDNKPFKGVTGFEFSAPNVLENVLTMGYPPVTGFDAILIAETAQISALKATVGQVVGESPSYLDRQNYFLISVGSHIK